MSEDIHKRVQAYLDGFLSDAEKEVFEKELSSDKLLQNELELQKDCIAVLRAKADIDLKKNLLKDWEKIKSAKAEEEANTTVKTKKRNLVYYLSRIAAVGLFLFGSWWGFQSSEKDSSVDSLATEFLDEKYKAPTYTKNNAEEVDENWKKAIESYQNKKYKETGLAIEKIVTQGNETTEHQFYLGLSYLYQQNPDFDKAINYFQKSLEPTESLFKNQARWFIALAYLKNGDLALGIQYLEQIVSSDSWKKEEAKVLLESRDYD